MSMIFSLGKSLRHREPFPSLVHLCLTTSPLLLVVSVNLFKNPYNGCGLDMVMDGGPGQDHDEKCNVQ